MNKSYVHCDFSKWFIDYLKNAYEIELYVCCCWYLEFTSVDLLPFKIKIFDRLTCISTVMQRCQISRFRRIEPPAILLKIPQSPATVPHHLPHFEISRCFFPVYPHPPCVISCVIQIPKIIILCLPYTLILGCNSITDTGHTSTHTGRPVLKQPVGLDSTC